MIRTEREYRKVAWQLEEQRVRVAEYRAALEGQGLDEDAVWWVVSPMVAVQSQAEADIDEYERSRRRHGDIVVEGEPG